jgi:hypothetical protein
LAPAGIYAERHDLLEARVFDQNVAVFLEMSGNVRGGNCIDRFPVVLRLPRNWILAHPFLQPAIPQAAGRSMATIRPFGFPSIKVNFPS